MAQAPLPIAPHSRGLDAAHGQKKRKNAPLMSSALP
eukprot:CAMPEP_0182875998 /NCGR_PEP_ID=MMETSP0034_2-20130328/13889_1 /TAXON_ID=156128 /ORGANISM="Nephroselmis pyriformis, Strain CCMP717" /LENGTH=35 /DNA_ID= /DNA_START= /DNA_END= /DNA_ORIENTATION=